MWIPFTVVLKCVSKSELELFQLLPRSAEKKPQCKGSSCVAYHQLFTAKNDIDYMDLKYDLPPNQGCSNQYSLIKAGNLRAEIYFARMQSDHHC